MRPPPEVGKGGTHSHQPPAPAPLVDSDLPLPLRLICREKTFLCHRETQEDWMGMVSALPESLWECLVQAHSPAQVYLTTCP